MVIQLLGMMAHRVFTFLQIVSTIELCRSQKEPTDLDDENVLPKDRGYKFAKVRVDLQIHINFPLHIQFCNGYSPTDYFF